MSTRSSIQLYMQGNPSLEFLIEDIWKYVYVSLRNGKEVCS